MKEILKYQKLDIELNKVKKLNANSVERANMTKLKGYIMETKDKTIKLDANAKTLIDEYNKLKKQYDAHFEKVQALINTDLSKVDADDITDILATINALSSEIYFLDRNINAVYSKIKEKLDEFAVAKENINKARKKYDVFKAKYEQDQKAVLPQVEEIEKQMAEMEKTVKPELLAKYKAVKADKVFPVFVPYVDGHCSGCRVEIPTAKANKLKSDGTIVCECHRILYLPQK